MYEGADGSMEGGEREHGRSRPEPKGVERGSERGEGSGREQTGSESPGWRSKAARDEPVGCEI